MTDGPAHHGEGVHAVGHGGQHVRVPHPVDVQRGTELCVRLHRVGDGRDEWQPVFLISEIISQVKIMFILGDLNSKLISF